MAFLPLLVAIGLAVGPGRCQNTCSISWDVDPRLANLVPNFNPGAEETGLDGVSCASKCSDYPWCSSFFIQTSGRCLMFKTVFITKVKMVSSPGTVYNRIYSDDCPVEKCYYKSREHNLCLCFFGIGRDTVRVTNQESIDKCSAINGHLSILDTKNKMEWVKGVFQSNTVMHSDGWSFYLDGKRIPDLSYAWGDGQKVPLNQAKGGVWKSNFPIAAQGFDCLAAVTKRRPPFTMGWVNFHCDFNTKAVVCQYRALNN